VLGVAFDPATKTPPRGHSLKSQTLKEAPYRSSGTEAKHCTAESVRWQGRQPPRCRLDSVRESGACESHGAGASHILPYIAALQRARSWNSKRVAPKRG